MNARVKIDLVFIALNFWQRFRQVCRRRAWIYAKKDIICAIVWAASSIIRGIVQGAERQGVEPGLLLGRCGISEAELASPAARIPYDRAQAVWENALALSRDPFLGLHIGSGITADTMGLVGNLMQNAQTVGQAFDDLKHLSGLVTDMMVYDSFVQAPYFVAETRPASPWLLQHPATAYQAGDQSVAGIINVVRLFAGKSIDPHHAELMRPADENAGFYTLKLRCPVRFSSEANRVYWPQDIASRPVSGVNPELYTIIRGHIEKQLLAGRKSEASEQVRRQLLLHYSDTLPAIPLVAMELGMSARTLQRKLAQENTTYQQLLGEVKMNLARQLLRTSDRSIAEIAYSLGYAEAASFRLAFRKYAGMKPLEFRRACADVTPPPNPPPSPSF